MYEGKLKAIQTDILQDMLPKMIALRNDYRSNTPHSPCRICDNICHDCSWVWFMGANKLCMTTATRKYGISAVCLRTGNAPAEKVKAWRRYRIRTLGNWITATEVEIERRTDDT